MFCTACGHLQACHRASPCCSGVPEIRICRFLPFCMLPAPGRMIQHRSTHCLPCNIWTAISFFVFTTSVSPGRAVSVCGEFYAMLLYRTFHPGRLFPQFKYTIFYRLSTKLVFLVHRKILFLLNTSCHKRGIFLPLHFEAVSVAWRLKYNRET